jgi:hypothetical protein
MSRSHKSTPIAGITTSESEKYDKKAWHSRFRSAAKRNICACADFEDHVDVNFREVSNVQSMAKDGRKWLDLVKKPHFKKYLRK